VTTGINVTIRKPEKLNIRAPQAKTKKHKARGDDEQHTVRAVRVSGEKFVLRADACVLTYLLIENICV
jgi:hypothetical protein